MFIQYRKTQDYSICEYLKKFLLFAVLPNVLNMLSKEFLPKLNLCNLNNSHLLPNSLSSHVHLVSQNSGLFNLWKYFKKFLHFTVMTSKCTENALKQFFRKTALVKVEQL